jgi:uncharacterized repeat protein (TIGR02543 family)
MTAYQTSSFSILYINDAGELFGLGRNTSGIYGNGATSSTILTVPVPLTSFLPLNEGESIANLRTTGLSNSGVVAMLLTTQNRLLVAGSNLNLIDGSQASSVNITTYKDITASLNLNGNETISELILATDIQGVRTSTNRFIIWGANNPVRLFPQPGGLAVNIPVGTPTDVTALLNQPLVPGETIELLSVTRTAGVYKTSNNRYFVWGDNSSFALMMFQAQNFASSVPVEVTTSVLNLIGQNNEIVKFVPMDGSFTMNFFTNDNKLYNYGDYRNVFLPNTTDRPTLQLPFFGDSTPLEISSKFELLEGEYPTHAFAYGFLTNLNRYRRGTTFQGPYALSTADLSNILRPGETIVASFGIVSDARFTTSYGRVFSVGNSTTIVNVTSTTLTEKLLSTLPLPYNEDITYVPVREGFTFEGWFTDKNLNSPFTGKVPANNNLVLYGLFVPIGG